MFNYDALKYMHKALKVVATVLLICAILLLDTIVIFDLVAGGLILAEKVCCLSTGLFFTGYSTYIIIKAYKN